MAGESSDDVRAHIESIASRTRRDLVQLTDRLHVRSWPGGGHDRNEPGARDWLRRWRPSGPTPLLPLCGCAQGRCVVCN
jgi:hypothetical protein